MSHPLLQTLLLASVNCGLALFVSLANLHRVQHSREEHGRAGLAEPSDYTGSFDPRYTFTYHRSEFLLLQARELAAGI